MPPSYNAFIKTSPRSLRNVGRDVRSHAAVVPMSPMVFAVSMGSGARKVRTSQSRSQFRAADQSGLGRDPNDVGVPGQLDRREDTAVAESSDENALTAHRGKKCNRFRRAARLTEHTSININ